MKIGELATRTGTPVETIRYYEREGLLPEPARTASNYRDYGEPHAERLSFIRHCRGLDMTLDEIRVLLRFKDSPEENCGQVNALLDEHIVHVSQRIAALRDLERQLKTLRKTCQAAQAASACGILAELSDGSRLESTPLPADLHVHGTHKGGVKAGMKTGTYAGT